MKLSIIAGGIGMLSATGAAVYLLSSPGAADPVRMTAWNLAKQEIQNPGRRGLPGFATWYVRGDIRACANTPTGDKAVLPEPSTQFTKATLSEGSSPGQAGVYSAMHNFRRDAPISFGAGSGFRYNSLAAARLCDFVAGSGSPRTASAGVGSWWKHVNPQPPVISPTFPNGSATAAVFWYVVKQHSPNQNSFPIPVRSGSVINNRNIQVVIPQCILDQTPCPAAPATPGPAPGPKLVSLDKFVWVRFENGDVFSGASPGDFLILVAFHLVHKQASGWLWSTFWWDPDSTEFGTGVLGSLSGIDSRTRAWNNYAMDAAADTYKEIFNPWREPAGSNCAFCHQHATFPLPKEEPLAGHGLSSPPPGVLSFDFVFAAPEGIPDS